MKYVHSPDMVAHLWANQSQESARNAGHTFYFDGDTIYSYGSHFPIARHVQHKGKSAILMTTASYSVTTSSHQSMVRRAIKAGETIFMVPHVSTRHGLLPPHADNLKYFADQIKDSQANAAKGKRFKAAGHKESAVSYARQGNEYADFFGLKTRFKADEPTSQELLDRRDYKEALDKRTEERRAKELERRKKQRELDALDYEQKKIAWLAGEPVRISWMHGENDTLLRINGDMVETSKGAEVPLDHALRILPFVRAGQAWHRNGQEIRIGQFYLDSIDELGNIKAGCHTIKREELERLAATIGK